MRRVGNPSQLQGRCCFEFGMSMKLFEYLKGRLPPPSSRSFHELFSEVIGLRHDICELSRQLESLRADLQHESANAVRSVQACSSAIGEMDSRLAIAADAHDTHMKLMLWSLIAREGETSDDAKRRFFRSLPKADGDLRLLQRGCVALLSDFDNLCKNAGLPYCMMFGTLLGAVRHQGFVPWDDDLDVCMVRDDIATLMDVVSQDDRYLITVVFDWYAHCRQIRFRYNDENNPCFIDLFILDYAQDEASESFYSMLAVRRAMIQEMDSSPDLSEWRESHPYLELGSELAVKVDEVFRHYEAHLHSECICVSRENARGLIWGIDNCYWEGDGSLIYGLSELLPLEQLEFEGIALSAPSDASEVLRRSYGDYLALPEDIHSHYEHVSKTRLASEVVKKSIRKHLQ